MNQKDIEQAKYIIRGFVDINKSRLPKDHILNYGDLKEIIQTSIDGLKASNQMIEESEQSGLYDILLDDILREEYCMLKSDKDLEKNIICDKDHKPWLLPSGQPIDPDREKVGYKYWNRYRQFISNQKKINMEDFDGSVRQIVSNLQDPLNRNKDGWLNRGMVVGSVQSGKTMNYAGVVAQALDAGYQFIVVLGGAGKKLRAQTQARIDEGVLGIDTSGKIPGWIGAGKLKMVDEKTGKKVSHRNIVSLTSSFDDGDFSTNSKKVQNYNIDWNENTQPHLFVMKKNVSILNNFLEWIEKTQREDKSKRAELSLLIIDDECDWGSVDTASFDDPEEVLDEEYNPSAINECITNILDKFKWKSYLGYTATPYANIFQRRDLNDKDMSLFPSNFIVYLQPNRMYFGPSQFFNSSSSENAVDLVRNVPMDDFNYFDELVKERSRICNKKGLFTQKGIDYTLQQKKELKDLRDIETFKLLSKHEGDPAPDSLSLAIKTFIISCAIRWTRGEKMVFNSMLVHIQRMVIFQDFTTRMVKEELGKIKNQIVNQNMKSFEKIYNQDFINTTNETLKCDAIDRGIKVGIHPLESFEEITESIDEVMDRISVVREYGKGQEDRLDYSEDKKGNYYICIGSDILSRGLTLEGLTVSYFLREAKTYDTLMQMGRWFGYRSGYLDLCRVFTTPLIVEFFLNVKHANEAMYQMFQEMNDRDDIPKNFGMYILSSDAAQKVTGYGKTKWTQNYSLDIGRAFHNETRSDISKDRLNHNFNYINQFLRGKKNESSDNSKQVYHLDTQNFINFIKNYKFSFDKSRKINHNFMSSMYIDYVNKIERNYTKFNGFKLIITSGIRSTRVPWIINNKDMYSTERFQQVNTLKDDRFWLMPGSGNDGQLDKKYQEKYLSNGIGFIILRPMYGPSNFSESEYTKDEIFSFIDNKSYKEKDIKILGIDYPVFHELIRVPNRASLGLDESETRMDLVVDLKYLENLAIPFQEDKDGEYI